MNQASLPASVYASQASGYAFNASPRQDALTRRPGEGLKTVRKKQQALKFASFYSINQIPVKRYMTFSSIL